MASPISINYAMFELVVSAQLSFVLLIFLIHLIRSMFIDPAKKSAERIIELCKLSWSLSLFIVVLIKIFAWTDIWSSFPESCYEGKGHSYCQWCDWSVKARYLMDSTSMLSGMLFFYAINTMLEPKVSTKLLRNWMFVVVAVNIAGALDVLTSTHTGFVQELNGHGKHQYSVCEWNEPSDIQSGITSGILIYVQYILQIVTLIAFNGTFVWRAIKIWKQSCHQHFETTKKIKSLESATNSIIRHCILAISLISTILIFVMVCVFSGKHEYLADSIWLWIWFGLLYLMFSGMDSKYQMVFGRVHRCLFTKWMARYSVEVQRIKRMVRLAELAKKRGSSKLCAIPENKKQIGVEPEVKSETVPSRDVNGWNSTSPSPFTAIKESMNEQDSRSTSNSALIEVEMTV